MPTITLPEDSRIFEIDDEKRPGNKRIYYEKFLIDDNEFLREDDVFLFNSAIPNNKISKTSLKKSAYIVRLKEIFADKYDNKLKYHAHVLWYWRNSEFSAAQMKTIDANIKTNEIVLDISSTFDREIELNSVICKANLKFDANFSDFNILKSQNSGGKFDFSVSRYFDGKKIHCMSTYQTVYPQHMTPKKENSKSRISHIDSSKLLGTPESNKLKAPNSSDFLTPRRTLLTNRMISLKLASITPKKGKKPSQSEPRASIHAIENSSESDLSDDQSNSISSGFEEELLDLNSSSIRTRSTKYRRKCDSTSQASQDSQVSTFTKRKFSFSAKKQTPVKNILRPKRKSIRNVNFEEVPSDQKLEILSNLCCRESEYEQIYNSIYSHLISQSGGCVYISGVPGTGKTATINNVIQNLSKKLHEVVDYQLIQINAMNLSSPKEFYTAFADYLNGFTLSVDDSLNFLNRKFGPDHIVKMKPTLLIIDEVDYLYTKSQDIFYSIFDWTNSHNSKLIVVTLSNMFDLPERMMSNKIISRLGMTRINFAPYTFKQLVEIANAHFKDSQIKFESDALQFICRKIAAGSGDARRLLEVASQALVIAKETDKHLATINMKHCDTILKQIFSSQKIQIVKSLSDYEKDFLRFIAMEYETANSTEPMTEACQSHSNQIFVETIVEKYKVKRSIETKSKFEGTNSDLLLIIRMLSTLGLISIKNIKKGCAIHQSLILLSSPTDLIVATN